MFYLKITKEAPFVAGSGGAASTGGYNSGPMTAPVKNKDYIWLDYGANVPNIKQVLVPWSVQSVAPSRGLTQRLAGADQYNVGGSLTTLLYHSQAEFWKEAVLEPTVVDGVPHLPSYTIDRVIVGNNGIKWTDRFKGVVFTQATISSSSEGTRAPVTLSVSLVGGERVEIPASPAFTGPACDDLPTDPYRWNKSTLILDATGTTPIDTSPFIRSWSVQINHMVTTRRNKGQYVTGVNYGGWSPSMQANWDIDSWAMKEKYLKLLTSQAAAQFPDSTLKLEDTVTDGSTLLDWTNFVLTSVDESLPVADFYTQGVALVPHYDCANWDLKTTWTKGAVRPTTTTTP